MSELPGRLVVRTYAPARRWLSVAAIALLGLFGLYLTYEFGRWTAGFDRRAVADERRAHAAAIRALEKQNRALRVQLAELETVRVSQTRERTEVARTIGELQAQVARQEQELAFFRGIVSQGSQAPDVRVRQLRILEGDGPRAFRLRLTLVQAVRPDSAVSGTLDVRIEGERGDSAAALAMPAFTADRRRELPFSFRYFHDLELQVTLPADFTAQRVTVEVQSNRRNVPVTASSFPWIVAAG